MRKNYRTAALLCALFICLNGNAGAQQHPIPSHVHPNPASLPFLYPANLNATILSVSQVKALYKDVEARDGVIINDIHLTTWGEHKTQDRQGIIDNEIAAGRQVYLVRFKYPHGYHYNGQSRGTDATGLGVLDAVDGRLLSFQLRGTALHSRQAPGRKQ